MRVRVKDTCRILAGQTGQVIGTSDTGWLQVRMDSDPSGPYQLLRADEVTIVR